MTLWSMAIGCLGLGVWKTLHSFDLTGLIGGLARERAALARVAALLQELEETLAAGLLPAPERWQALGELALPWGPLVRESLEELRRRGAALLPTLRRLRALSAEHRENLERARARSSQALVQAFFCAALVPLFGGTLALLLPEVAARPWLWSLACGLALGASCLGALWMLQQARAARWGGLPRRSRVWVLAAQCAGERFLALVRAGTPADLAWGRACEGLAVEAGELALAWGHSVWQGGAGSAVTSRAPRGWGRAEQPLLALGESLRKAVQVSLMDGRPCLERAEAALQAFRAEMEAAIEREMSLLTTRVLKPLFVCVAPALFSLLGLALFLAWQGTWEG